MAQDRRATLDRMILPDHTCPFGVRATQMLEESGFEIDDCILKSREEVARPHAAVQRYGRAP